jgi:hypothetical protein
MRSWWRVAIALVAAVILFYGYRELIPSYRVSYHSDLIMLGDFNGDHHWTTADRSLLQSLLANPYAHSPLDCLKADMNGNGLLDPEDLEIINRLILVPDPYQAEAQAMKANRPFPRPRELYRYVSSQDYLNRPLNTLPYQGASMSPLDCLREEHAPAGESPYADRLWLEVRDEAVRFDLAYQARMEKLTEVEKTYAQRRIDACNRQLAEGQTYELLLELMGLVEDTETLTTLGQDSFITRTLFFRDHLRELLLSSRYAEFQAGKIPIQAILGEIQRLLKQDLDLDVELEKLGPPRGFDHLQNYISRAEWQYYKSKTKTELFEQLIRFAQHDRRYLRAVSKTSRRQKDPGVQNHNLPMVLLFREAMRLCGNDKKAAVGLLDEAIRIPFTWVKSIPRHKLPGALALENFLLPGNKEDGSDKSRHWNVFGGICLYRSPQESVDLALKREMQDLREARYSKECMTEFIRDTIANLNGIYYVVSMDPDLLRR